MLHKGNIIISLSGFSSLDAQRCGTDGDSSGNPAAAMVSGSPPSVSWNPKRLSQKQEKFDNKLAVVTRLILARTRKWYSEIDILLKRSKGKCKGFLFRGSSHTAFGQIVWGAQASHLLEYVKWSWERKEKIEKSRVFTY